MRKLLILFAVVGIIAGAGYLAFLSALAYKARQKPVYRIATVERGEITSFVTSSGTVQPVRRVQVGSFVSGPIKELNVDFNSEVRQGEVMAEIDPRIHLANVARDEAAQATAKAEVLRVEAQKQLAVNDEDRARRLREKNPRYISTAEMDQLKTAREALEAQLDVAKAAVRQAEAALQMSKTNLEYCKILAPVSGTVIDRKVDPGQTVAASFQTPEMFVVAPEMDQHMWILASVDEADIGLIRGAKDRNEPVEFTVDAYREDLFQGKICQIRQNPTSVQNVVTYTVVVESPNPGRKLMPGMTANLSFRISRRENVVKVPNAALRFFPKPEEVREEDRKILEGKEEEEQKKEEEKTSDAQRSATERVAASRSRSRRHVWVREDELLRAVEITTGISDNAFTELLSGDLKQGQELTTGIAPKNKKR